MNFIFVSPNFPERYYKWVEALRDHGVRVLGIGDTPVWNLHSRLTRALEEYYYVWDMNNHELMDKAVSYYQAKYGKIDFIESNNGKTIFFKKFFHGFCFICIYLTTKVM